MRTFEEFQQKLPKKVPDKFTARYYGTRALDIFPKEFLDLVGECSSFVDITAGGGRFLYDQAVKEKVVGANDRCFYSYCALFAVLVHHCETSTWLQCLWEQTHPKNIGAEEGFFTALKKTHVHDDVCVYIDALCRQFRNDPFLLYCVGKALRSTFTFRGLGWCPQTPFGAPSRAVGPEYIHNFLMKTAWTTHLYAERLSGIWAYQREVYNTDAYIALDTFKGSLLEGGLVYADPAWPWLQSNKVNPYKWLTEELSGILLQRSLEAPFWPNDTSIIFNDTDSWITRSLNRGAKYFVLCGQDTNFPPLSEIRDHLNKKFKLVKWIEVEDKSKAAHKSYRTAWGVIANA